MTLVATIKYRGCWSAMAPTFRGHRKRRTEGCEVAFCLYLCRTKQKRTLEMHLTNARTKESFGAQVCLRVSIREYSRKLPEGRPSGNFQGYALVLRLRKLSSSKSSPQRGRQQRTNLQDTSHAREYYFLYICTAEPEQLVSHLTCGDPSCSS